MIEECLGLNGNPIKSVRHEVINAEELLRMYSPFYLPGNQPPLDEVVYLPGIAYATSLIRRGFTPVIGLTDYTPPVKGGPGSLVLFGAKWVVAMKRLGREGRRKAWANLVYFETNDVADALRLYALINEVDARSARPQALRQAGEVLLRGGFAEPYLLHCLVAQPEGEVLNLFKALVRYVKGSRDAVDLAVINRHAEKLVDVARAFIGGGLKMGSVREALVRGGFQNAELEGSLALIPLLERLVQRAVAEVGLEGGGHAKGQGGP